jgi:protein pelota
VKETVTGSVSKNKIRIRLTLRIERIAFDAEQCSLRLTGKNIVENEHVKVSGQYSCINSYLYSFSQFTASIHGR